MNAPIRPLHSYRALLVPADLAAEDVERAADAGTLRQLRLRAPSASWATRAAHALTGLAVLRVERVEPEATAA